MYVLACPAWYVLIFVKCLTHYPTKVELLLVSHQEILLRTVKQSKFLWSNSVSITVVLNLSSSWWLERSSRLGMNRQEFNADSFSKRARLHKILLMWCVVPFHIIKKGAFIMYICYMRGRGSAKSIQKQIEKHLIFKVRSIFPHV